MNEMHRKVCVQILQSESSENSGESAGGGTWEGEINLSMYIQTTVETIITSVCCFFFPPSASSSSLLVCLCWGNTPPPPPPPLHLCSSRSSCSFPFTVSDRSCPSSSTSTRSWPFSIILQEEWEVSSDGKMTHSSLKFRYSSWKHSGESWSTD